MVKTVPTPKPTAIALALSAVLASGTPISAHASCSSWTTGDLDTGSVVCASTTAVSASGSLGTLTNTGTISGLGGFGLGNTGSISALLNSGLLSGSDSAIYNGNTIVSLVNSNGGSGNGLISGGSNGVLNGSNGLIVSLTNDAAITGSIAGINNSGFISSLTNNSGGSISGVANGINNTGLIGSLNNDGTISGASTGIYNSNGASIGTLTNSGAIQGSIAGVYNSGTIGALSNSGSISSIVNDAQGTIGDAFSQYGVDNSGSIGTLTNSGAIKGSFAGINNSGFISSLTNNSGGSIGGVAYGINNTGLIGSLNNDGTISGASTGIYNSNGASIGTLTNSGAIQGSIAGVYNSGTIEALSNSGSISSIVNDAQGTIGDPFSQYGIDNSGSIGTLTNSGAIKGSIAGINNSGFISSLTNNSGGSIGGVAYGIDNTGLIGSLNNDGTISGASAGIYNSNGASIGTLTNSGAIQGSIAGVYNSGTIEALSNSGSISSIVNDALGTIGDVSSQYGIDNSGSIGTLTNSGVIKGSIAGINNSGFISSLTNNSGGSIGGVAYGIDNTGLIGSLNNGGTISGASTGIYNSNGASIGTLTNSGAIQGSIAGVYNSGTIEALSNSGSISSIVNDALGTIGNAFSQYGVDNSGSIGTLTNSGGIKGSIAGINNSGFISSLTNNSGGSIGGAAYGIDNTGLIGSLNNGGTISGASAGLYNGNGASIGTLTNSGAIQGSIAGVYNSGTIDALSNSGSISSIVNDAQATIGNASSQYGVDNSASIGTLANSGAIKGSIAGINNSGFISSLTNNSGGSIGGAAYGINNTGLIGSLNNGGTISGASAGLYNGSGASIGTLTNSGAIQGSIAGVHNGGTITSLTNTGSIRSSATGVFNGGGGSISALTNSGVITGGDNAIYNDSLSRIGTLTNSGVIAGNIQNDSNNSLTIDGGTGTVFGTLTGVNGSIGAITNLNSNLVFGTGNLLLNDAIDVGGNVVQNNGATLRVDAPLTITGNYSQGASATLLIGVQSGATTTGSLATDSGYGRLVVSGSATIAANSSVGLTSQGYAFVAGQRYVVVDASATGTDYNESTLNYSATNANGSSYSGPITGTVVTANDRSDLVLGLSGTAARTPASNANAIASLDGLGRYTGVGDAALLNLYNATLALNATGTTEQANRAGAQLSPVRLSSGATAASTFDALRQVSVHSDSLRLAQAYGSGVATGDSPTDWALWGQPFDGSANQGSVGQIDGYTASYGGLVVGADKAITDRLRAGAAFSYANTSINHDGNISGDSSRINGFGLIGYASYSGEPWYVNLSAGAVLQQFDTTRTVDFTGFSGTANSNSHGWQYVASAEFGYPLFAGAFTFTPTVGLVYSYQLQNAYTESGGNGAALAVQSTSSTSLRSLLGIKIERAFEASFGVIVPDVQLKWTHEYRNSASATTASYVGDPTGQTAFTTVGATPLHDLGNFSVGVTWLRSNNMTLGARYELQAGSHFISHTGSVRVRWLF